MKIRIRYGVLPLFLLTFLISAAAVRFMILYTTPSGSGLEAGDVARAFITGFIFDLAALSYFLIPAGIYLMVAPERWVQNRLHRWVILFFYFAFVFVMLFDGVAEYLFFDEYATRFNFIAVDYLVYTHEVVGNIIESYHVYIMLSLIFIAAGLICLSLRKTITGSSLRTFASPHRRKRGAALLLAPVVAFLAIDSSIADFSDNMYIDDLAQNGIYSLFAAFRNNELDFNRFYRTESPAAVMPELRTLVEENNSRYKTPDRLTRAISNPGDEKHLNIILVVEESLSAAYLGCFGNPGGLTPNLDRLSENSMLFTHLYAAGNRTVRGLEALTLAMPPLPGISIVKRKDNKNFRSWGEIMREKNYDTKFIYAGYGYFDNMNDFFGGNGYTIVDRSAFSKDEVTFATIWGVCDEDLFDKAIKESRKSYQNGKPFFSTVMTTSNHKPFEYPAGKIDIPSGSGGRRGGVKYADYAIGRFINKASREPWFSNTLFVFVADHCASSAGKTELPLKKYEIPLLIYSPGNIPPRRIDTLMSQIDIPPTVMGLLNDSYTSDFFGRDVIDSPDKPERAFIATYQKLGYIEKDTMGVLSPQKKTSFYRFDRKTGEMEKIPGDPDFLSRMEAYYQGANEIFTQRLNRFR
jgi:phosphoglycerol transferase MdoB-like AlkP superfamily enzyme